MLPKSTRFSDLKLGAYFFHGMSNKEWHRTWELFQKLDDSTAVHPHLIGKVEGK